MIRTRSEAELGSGSPVRRRAPPYLRSALDSRSPARRRSLCPRGFRGARASPSPAGREAARLRDEARPLRERLGSNRSVGDRLRRGPKTSVVVIAARLPGPFEEVELLSGDLHRDRCAREAGVDGEERHELLELAAARVAAAAQRTWPRSRSSSPPSVASAATTTRRISIPALSSRPTAAPVVAVRTSARTTTPLPASLAAIREPSPPVAPATTISPATAMDTDRRLRETGDRCCRARGVSPRHRLAA